MIVAVTRDERAGRKLGREAKNTTLRRGRSLPASGQAGWGTRKGEEQIENPHPSRKTFRMGHPERQSVEAKGKAAVSGALPCVKDSQT